MMVIKKENFDKEMDANGSGTFVDHPGHCGYEFEP